MKATRGRLPSVLLLMMVAGSSMVGVSGMQRESSSISRRGSLAWMTSAFLTTAPRPAAAAEWQLGNGNVQIPDPFAFGGGYKLSKPRLLGSGGGGAVFSLKAQDNRQLALKISWVKSAASVENEGRILRELETNHVTGVERCLGMTPYPTDPRRVMILLEPVVESSVASVQELDSEAAQARACTDIARSLIQMLHAQVVTTDVQPLLDTTTGSLLLIDLTEAKKVSEPLSFLDVALARSFCTEMLSLIPETYYSLASDIMLKELQNIGSLPKAFYEILIEQSILSPQALEWIESKIGVE
jgi:hypothetical protein